MFRPNKIIKSIAFIFGVIALSFSLNYAVLAVWKEPALVPPDGNVSPPLNTGNALQIKEAGLILNYNGYNGGLLTLGGKTDPVPPFGLLCPAGYDWYDYDSDSIKDNGECQITTLYASGIGNVGIGTTDPKAKLYLRLDDIGASSLVPHSPGDPLDRSVMGGNLALEGTDSSLSFACADDSLNCSTIRFNQFNTDAGKTFRNVWAISTIAANSGDAMRITFGRDSSFHHNDTLFSIVPRDPTAFPDNLGNVGINTKSPINTFDVTGSLNTSKMIVDGYYGYKSGTTIYRTSGPVFTAADVGRYFGWNNGTSDRIVAYIDANRVTAASSSTIASLALPIGGRISEIKFYVSADGNVGIGTDNPVNAKLYVMGDDGIMVDGEGSSAEIQLKVPTTGFNWRISTGDGEKLKFGNTADASDLKRVVIDQNANVGIGTTSPTAKLDVIGNVRIGSGAANSAGAPGKAVCMVTATRRMGVCSTQPNATGNCTCEPIN